MEHRSLSQLTTGRGKLVVCGISSEEVVLLCR